MRAAGMRGDYLDMLIHEKWRPGRMQILGITHWEKLEPKERLGKLRSTLGSIKEEGQGAAYSGNTQNWPEFRDPDGIFIQRAFLAMNYHRRQVMDARYTWARIYPASVRIDAVGMETSHFWVEVGNMKRFIDDFMKNNPPRDAYSGHAARHENISAKM